jgi:hypothetical protein
MSDLPDHLSDFLKDLKQSGFAGDCETSYGARIVAATDNSIYQVLPEAILFPAKAQDINRIVEAIGERSDQTIF